MGEFIYVHRIARGSGYLLGSLNTSLIVGRFYSRREEAWQRERRDDQYPEDTGEESSIVHTWRHCKGVLAAAVILLLWTVWWNVFMALHA